MIILFNVNLSIKQKTQSGIQDWRKWLGTLSDNAQEPPSSQTLSTSFFIFFFFKTDGVHWKKKEKRKKKNPSLRHPNEAPLYNQWDPQEGKLSILQTSISSPFWATWLCQMINHIYGRRKFPFGRGQYLRYTTLFVPQFLIWSLWGLGCDQIFCHMWGIKAQCHRKQFHNFLSKHVIFMNF